ncbi:hypothetical protein A2572_02830 [Candidatus Collierbacteria bacterium RIFOXYD1_FULL_40_9]|uniref:YgjP-like metallopeptidase domain-containing protein n=1 Tax=Candidatus Collierbacteria bacterium RIFOXYD1_FULL_40_9 TaxID=1817731 RepID=A0A1F5FU89_9BACT|nr:MAG: hypothetical protein A2572_02830 [Candidatus Collierbacteria bacterium RIFOXYD1_FULL_40_9]
MSNIKYTLNRSKKLLGNINLKVKNGEVSVSAPFWVSLSVIENFLESKRDWIIRALSRQEVVTVPKSYTDGEKHLLYGNQIPLVIKKTKTLSQTTVSFDTQNLTLNIFDGFTDHFYTKEVEKALTSFYLQELSFYLTEKVNHYTKLLGVDYSKIEIKKVSSIWGSCSPQKVLSFNRKLIQSPKEIIDYVVIHEVCHLKEANHSSRFWAQVSKLDKDFKNHRRWLHQNGVKLDI